MNRVNVDLRIQSLGLLDMVQTPRYDGIVRMGPGADIHKHREIL